LILHGVENWRPREHWQWWLADQLRLRGEQVLYPQLPSPSDPSLSEWLRVLHGELAQLGDAERIVIAHSCAVALWLLAAPEISEHERVDRVALIAPPGRSAFTTSYRAFVPVGLDRAAIHGASRRAPVLITSDNDPYCPEGLEEYRATYSDALGLHHHVIPGAGHISAAEGYGPWPAILEWCLAGACDWRKATPLTGGANPRHEHVLKDQGDSASLPASIVPSNSSRTFPPVANSASALLCDLLDELHQRVRALVKGVDIEALYWQADSGGNSCGVTVWHFTRWLDVMSVRVIDGRPSDDELWFAEGWSLKTGYDPRGLGEGGLGVLTGYTISEVLEVPRLSVDELIEYQHQVVQRLRPQLARLSGPELASEPRGKQVMEARERVTGPKATFGWTKHLLIGCFQHVGEIAAILAMHQRLRGGGRR
jgi:predicted alpha/beta hydrolase family esterase